VIATALKANAAPRPVIEQAVRVMTTLNRGAAAAMISAGARAATDVTGYGLLGHLRAMLRASGAAASVTASAVPLLPGALDLAAAGHVPGGTLRNLTDLEPDVTWAADIGEPLRTLLADAQTSGGLLIALPGGHVPELLEVLSATDAPAAAIVGSVEQGRPGAIRVL
jgi:selenide,water dikinase